MNWSALKKRSKKRWMLVTVVSMLMVGVASVSILAARETVPVVTVQIVNSFPHDANAFSQGLCFDAEGNFYEGTGMYGSSELRKVDLKSGNVLKVQKLPRDVFGEGITIWNNRVVQLTWKKQQAIVYDLATFRNLGTLRYRGEGWGITHDTKHLIMSNGSSQLSFMNPADFSVDHKITVVAGNRQLDNLNELEYINGEIWANVWYEDYIACIDPQTGKVIRWIDLRRVWPKNRRGDEMVLNGIAQHPNTGQIFITGKNWPKLYEIKINNPN
ncbi:Glutamine cyclotransferase [Polystyrenella longa]|uniref:Glutamine cyclotransferase n=1 Tax=Polystyrenella longa TaxID=2528007 RepID=A0A518CNW8_9PLAN|nr:glutaminyl-peptide cyclotransferase [Polystyrenella longa]QDU80921.1 Glutamine cyclotransferase [Polystyrenella longa]